MRHKKTLQIYNQSNGRSCELELKRDHTVLIYVKRRLAMCWRKLGRVKEAAKVFKELTKEPPNVNWLNASLGENLIECYLELGDYANAQVAEKKNIRVAFRIFVLDIFLTLAGKITNLLSIQISLKMAERI